MMRKYNKVEKVEVASPEDHDKIESELKKVGKTSLKDVTDEERQAIMEEIDD